MKNKIILFIICFLSVTFAMEKTNNFKNIKRPFTTNDFDTLYSNKKLGYSYNNKYSIFRIFVPRASSVLLVIFEKYNDKSGVKYPMTRDQNGVWEYKMRNKLFGKYYGYYINGNYVGDEKFDETYLIPDPYSKAVATQNNYHINAKTLIYKDDFNWKNDKWVIGNDPRDLIIYEAHVRDMTAHSSSKADNPGTYLGLAEPSIIKYLKKLGINAIELLPIHDFANIEIPYQKETPVGTNTWNPYARNHWGYMSTFFFTPESYYSTDDNMKKDKYIGVNGKQIKEFKTMVKKLHDENIAVILDVVFNHVSNYDANPFKLIDKEYYFRLDSNKNYIAKSGCGNDFKTESKMSRKMILDAIEYWMKEYHIDGFRFDLGALIDEKTLEMILEKAKKINPNVFITAEPWGGVYKPKKFSELGWSSWNDQFRNGIKGENPEIRPGFIFGKWEHKVKKENFLRFLSGSLQSDSGQYLNTAHSVNYLACHDGYTFGDFIRLAKKSDTTITTSELQLNKFGAFILATSQGIMMMHSGQEFARPKIIAETDVPEEHIGELDHNSYNKDNETNYINYNIASENMELINYYSKLIKLRMKFPQLRKANRKNIKYIYSNNNDFGLGYFVNSKNNDIMVLLNGNNSDSADFELP
ncbi:MAG: alpha-amylase family glycosyl hydrolase, partial [Candidatus Marinimicrobia bacterium]|nr:alpha-amylase family glycosyl hydrolase [Candidatus Neomarinimicrobiota bacterium]